MNKSEIWLHNDTPTTIHYERIDGRRFFGSYPGQRVQLMGEFLVIPINPFDTSEGLTIYSVFPDDYVKIGDV